jgi:single-strand DNA-binding protein
MARDLNLVILTGRLTKDVDVKIFDNGRAVINGTIASNRSIKKNGEYVTETYYADFKYFTGNPEVANKLTKATLVSLTGELKTDKFVGQDGANKYKDYVLVSEINVISSPSPTEEGEGEAPEELPI